jgi:hypothetical protein
MIIAALKQIFTVNIVQKQNMCGYVEVNMFLVAYERLAVDVA